MTEVSQRDVFLPAADGTLLFADDRGPLDSPLPPVVCLPGLTRNSRDFDPVLSWMPNDRRVVAMDLRGRGRSARAADPMTYTPQVEMQDVLGILDRLGIGRFALLGTSRGGIIAMIMAAVAKERLAGVFLNDIGGQIEAASLLRIGAMTGSGVSYGSWDEAAAGFAWSAIGFEALPHATWLNVVRRIYHEDNGRIVHSHDLALSKTLPPPDESAAGKPADLWPLVPALAGIPVSVLRGAGSDLLSPETVVRMQAMLPDLDASTVPGRGHVPFLDETESVIALRRWLARVDANKKGR